MRAKEKAQIFSIAAVFILLVLAAYFVWTFFIKETPEAGEPKFEEKFTKTPQTTGPSAGITSFKPTTTSIFSFPETFSGESGVFEFLKIPILGQEVTPPFQPLSETLPSLNTLPATGEIPLFLREVELIGREIQEREVSVSADTPINFGSVEQLAIPEKEITLSVTSEQFHSLYPDYFIGDLQEAQSLIKAYDPSYQPLGNIENDSDVRFIQEKFVFVLFYAGVLTKEEAENYLITIRYTLPWFQLMELGITQTEKDLFTLVFDWPKLLVRPAFGKILSENSLAYELIGKLRQFFIPTAEAGYCGYCYFSPECFQPGIASPGPGANTFTAFCRCDGCYYGQGCLDRCSPGPAIWDPMTGICGCG